MDPEHTSAALKVIDPRMYQKSQSEHSIPSLRPSAQRLWKALSFEHDDTPEKVPENDAINKYITSSDRNSYLDSETYTASSNTSDFRRNQRKSTKDTKGRNSTLEAHRKSEKIQEHQNKLAKYLNRSSELSVPPSLRTDSQFAPEICHQPRLPFHSNQFSDSSLSLSSKQALSTSIGAGISISSTTVPSNYTFSNISEVPEPSILEHSLTLKSLQQSFKEAQANNTIEEVDVLCVNCYECIPIDQVDTHSDLCCKPVAIVPEVEDDVDIRIRKLMTAMQERQASYTGDRVIMLLQLQEITHSVLENSLSLDTILQKLEVIAKNSILMSDGYGCTVFARRLAVLAESKSSDLPQDSLKTGDSLLRQYEEEVVRQRQELEKWKLRNELLSQLAAQTAPTGYRDIDSEVDGDFDKCSIVSGSSGMSEIMSDVGDIEVIFI